MAFLLTSKFSLFSALAGVSAAATGAAFAAEPPPDCPQPVAVSEPTTCRRLATVYGVKYGALVAANHASMCSDIASEHAHTRPTHVCIPYAGEETNAYGLGAKSMARSGGSPWDSISVIKTMPPPDCPQLVAVSGPTTCRRLATVFGVKYDALVAANHASMCSDIASEHVHTRVCIPYAGQETNAHGLGAKSMARSGGSTWDSVIKTMPPPDCPQLVAVSGPTTCRRLATVYGVKYGALVATNHASMCSDIASEHAHTRPTHVCIPYAGEETNAYRLGAKSTARSGGSSWDSVTVAMRLLCLVNQERQRHGRRPLGLDPRLVDAAQRQSNDMARHVRMGHVGADGSQINDRARDAGYTFGGVGENISVGQTSEEDVNRSWIRSAGHHRNMLGNHQHFGAAVARGGDGRLYWTEMFGSNGGAHLDYPVCP